MNEIRAKLERRLNELLTQGNKITRHLRQEDGALPQDWEEQGTALENAEVLEALDIHTRDEIEKLRAALERLDADVYDACAKCGEKIGIRRLEALPFTSLCINCAS